MTILVEEDPRVIQVDRDTKIIQAVVHQIGAILEVDLGQGITKIEEIEVTPVVDETHMMITTIERKLEDVLNARKLVI